MAKRKPPRPPSQAELLYRRATASLRRRHDQILAEQHARGPLWFAEKYSELLREDEQLRHKIERMVEKERARGDQPRKPANGLGPAVQRAMTKIVKQWPAGEWLTRRNTPGASVLPDVFCG